MLVEDWHWADTGSRAAFVRVADLAAARPAGADRDEPRGAGRRGSLAGVDDVRAPRAARLRRVGRDHRGGARRAARCPTRWRGGCTTAPAAIRSSSNRCARRCSSSGGDGARRRRGRRRRREPRSRCPRRCRASSARGSTILDARALEVVARRVGDRPRVRSRAARRGGARRRRSAAGDCRARKPRASIQQTSVAPTIAYRFTHALTQEVCYDSLVGHQRKTLHGAIGRALASTHADRDGRTRRAARPSFRARRRLAGGDPFRAAGRGAGDRAQPVRRRAGDLDQVLEWAGRLPDRRQRRRRGPAAPAGARVRDARPPRAPAADHRRADRAPRARRKLRAPRGGLSAPGRPLDAAQAIRRRRPRAGHRAADRPRARRHHAGAQRPAQSRPSAVARRAARRSARDHAARARRRSRVRRRRRGRRRSDEPRQHPQGDRRLSQGRGRGSRKRSRCRRSATIPRSSSTRSTTWRTSIARSATSIARSSALLESDEIARVHLLPIQRSFHLTSIAHIQLQQGRIDDRAGDLPRSGRSEPARPARRRSGAVAADARQRAARPRALRRGAAVSAGGGAAVRAARRPRVGSRDADRRRPILERTSPDDARAGVERRADAAAPARRFARRAGSARRPRAGDARERSRTTAIPAFESALALAATIGERAREAAIRNTLGILEWERGGYAAALRHYESALALVRGQGKRAHEAVILNSLGASSDQARPAGRGAHGSRGEPGAQPRASASVSSKRTRSRRSVTSSLTPTI